VPKKLLERKGWFAKAQNGRFVIEMMKAARGCSLAAVKTNKFF
jgi:hypothetical protein